MASQPDIPRTMKGVQICQTGGVEVLELKDDIPVPTPSHGQVLVKNEYVGVNYIDTYFRSGLYPAPTIPLTLGRECAGTVVQQSSPPTPQSPPIGAKVVCLAGESYAQYTCANITHTYELPSSFQDTRVTAAGLLQGLTALTLIREAHHVQPGDWVLVHAAAGGMGLWLCQLLKAVGARTIATASTAEKRETARQAGAEVLLQYPEQMEGGMEGFVRKVMEATGDQGVACVLDGVGKATFDVSLACVARKGSLVSFGNASGAVPPLTISRLAAKNVRLMRPMLYGYVTTREEFEKYTRELVDWIAQGKVDVKIHKEYSLQDAKQAHTDIESRGTQGKLIFKL